MTKSFKVVAQSDTLSEDEHGLAYLVAVREIGNLGLIAHLRVLLFEDDGVNFVRIAWAQLTSEDEDVPLHETLDNGAWWNRALDAVLDEIVFNSPAVDHAVDDDGGVLQYAWVGGEIQVATLQPTGDAPEAPMTKCDIGNGPEWTRSIDEPPADVTDEQLERFFDEIAQMLAAKAFEAGAEDTNEGGDDDGEEG